MEYVMLNNGVRMPMLGFGVLEMRDERECEEAVADALEAGYRLIDTAQSYGNEAAVGRAVAQCGIPREDIFVTTKIKVANTNGECAAASFVESLERMGLDYADMLLIHHPYNDVYGAWRAMEQLQRDGLVRAIGVCNCPPDRLEDMVLHFGSVPQVMQTELHPFNMQKDVLAVMEKSGVQPQAHTPLAHGRLDVFNSAVLGEIGNAYGKSTAQVALRYLVQNGIAAIPKSAHADRRRENLDIFDFELTGGEMSRICALDEGRFTVDLHDAAQVDRLSSF